MRSPPKQAQAVGKCSFLVFLPLCNGRSVPCLPFTALPQPGPGARLRCLQPRLPADLVYLMSHIFCSPCPQCASTLTSRLTQGHTWRGGSCSSFRSAWGLSGPQLSCSRRCRPASTVHTSPGWSSPLSNRATAASWCQVSSRDVGGVSLQPASCGDSGCGQNLLPAGLQGLCEPLQSESLGAT